MSEEFFVGQIVRVTTTQFGGAVYDRKGNIVNANSPGVKFVYEGEITFIGPEGKGQSAIVVRCKAKQKSKAALDEFTFYPHEIKNPKNMGGKLVHVEILK